MIDNQGMFFSFTVHTTCISLFTRYHRSDVLILQCSFTVVFAIFSPFILSSYLFAKKKKLQINGHVDTTVVDSQKNC